MGEGGSDNAYGGGGGGGGDEGGVMMGEGEWNSAKKKNKDEKRREVRRWEQEGGAPVNKRGEEKREEEKQDWASVFAGGGKLKVIDGHARQQQSNFSTHTNMVVVNFKMFFITDDYVLCYRKTFRIPTFQKGMSVEKSLSVT